jgi:hypothetical protein
VSHRALISYISRFVFIASFAVLGTSFVHGASISLNTLNLVGTSTQLASGTVRLTDNTDPNLAGPPPAGGAWTTNTLNVANAFTASFDFQMGNWAGIHDGADGSGGDGIAFLIQNDFRGDTALGEGAGGMGFLGIFNSVAIMLDTFQNNSPNYYGDPSGNYISVNTRGTDFNVPHHFCTGGRLTADASIGSDLPGHEGDCTANPTLGMTGNITRLLDDGTVQNLTVNYVPGTLSIFLDGTLILTVPLNLATELNLTNGGGAFLGFTAGTRNSYQDQDIVDFSFTSSVPEPATGAELLAGLALAAMMARHRSKS